jgi:sorbitol-specific phosphotransferase system component IIA
MLDCLFCIGDNSVTFSITTTQDLVEFCVVWLHGGLYEALDLFNKLFFGDPR